MQDYQAARAEQPGRRVGPQRTLLGDVDEHQVVGGVGEPAQEDLGPAEERLRLFLIQYWGGPTTYSQLRGHPRLRMRHAPFKVGPAERDAWLRNMRVAVDSLNLDPEHERTLWQYLERAALHMVNSFE